jgi:hypothetical protein
VNLERTLFIVASKSGSTLEPNVFRDYFLGRMLLHAVEDAPEAVVLGGLLHRRARIGHGDEVPSGLAFGQQPGFPRLRILDSTDPDEVRAVEAAVNLERRK